MNAKKGNNILKVLIGVLALLLLGLGVYTIQFYSQTRKNVLVLKEKKIELKAELEELKAKYVKAISENEVLNDRLKKTKNHIQTLIDSLEKVKFDYTQLRSFRNQIVLLKHKNQNLFVVIDSLSTKNKSLRQEIDSTKTKLAMQDEYTDSLLLSNLKLKQKVTQASELKIIKSSSHAVRISNKEVEYTTNSNRSEKIEVCFTLGKNTLTESGKRVFFIQIINPVNHLLGVRKQIEFGEKVLGFSKKILVTYKNKKRKVCAFVKAEKEDLIPGRYIVNIFLKSRLLSSKRIHLE